MAHKPAISADILLKMANDSGVPSSQYPMPKNEYDALSFVEKLHATEAGNDIGTQAVASAKGGTDKSIG